MRPVPSRAAGASQRGEGAACVRGRRRDEEAGVAERGAILRHARGHVERHQALDGHTAVTVLICQSSHEVIQVRLYNTILCHISLSNSFLLNLDTSTGQHTFYTILALPNYSY